MIDIPITQEDINAARTRFSELKRFDSYSENCLLSMVITKIMGKKAQTGLSTVVIQEENKYRFYKMAPDAIALRQAFDADVWSRNSTDQEKAEAKAKYGEVLPQTVHIEEITP